MLRRRSNSSHHRRHREHERLLRELQNETDHWFWALEAITGENPVTEDDAGDMRASAQAWLEWGQRHGLVTK